MIKYNKIYKVLKIISAIGCVLIFSSCNERKEISRQSVGKITDASVIATSFNESPKTQVKTEQRFFVVVGLYEIAIGEEAQIVTFDDGRRYLSWPTGRYMAPIR